MITSIDQTALNLGFATLLGACIGVERQWRQRMAGLRTNTLVAIGAASFVIFEGLFPDDGSPTRVAAQVVSGIGFLGAGIIFREGLHVTGLNTAATLWCSAAVGLLAGSGHPLHAAASPATPAPPPRPCVGGGGGAARGGGGRPAGERGGVWFLWGETPRAT